MSWKELWNRSNQTIRFERLVREPGLLPVHVLPLEYEHCLQVVQQQAGLHQAEGGEGRNGDCFRHRYRRNIKCGICLRKRSFKSNSGIISIIFLICLVKPRGVYPTLAAKSSWNVWMGSAETPHIFWAFKNHPCKEDRTCEVRNFIREKEENASWTKKCCDNPTGLPVIPPYQNITTQGLREVGFLAKLPHIYSVSAGQGPHLSCPIFPWHNNNNTNNIFPHQ